MRCTSAGLWAIKRVDARLRRGSGWRGSSSSSDESEYVSEGAADGPGRGSSGMLAAECSARRRSIWAAIVLEGGGAQAACRDGMVKKVEAARRGVVNKYLGKSQKPGLMTEICTKIEGDRVRSLGYGRQMWARSRPWGGLSAVRLVGWLVEFTEAAREKSRTRKHEIIC